jgi:hypothetical protein
VLAKEMEMKWVGHRVRMGEEKSESFREKVIIRNWAKYISLERDREMTLYSLTW